MADWRLYRNGRNFGKSEGEAEQSHSVAANLYLVFCLGVRPMALPAEPRFSTFCNFPSITLN
jgi:hypothetical protein